nr:SOS response-associated peptidase family protein [Gordonibacter sp. An230]
MVQCSAQRQRDRRKDLAVCRRFVAVDRAEVARVATEVARALEARGDACEGLGALDALDDFQASLSEPTSYRPSARHDAFPSSVVTLIVPTGFGTQLAVADMTWGYQVPWKKGVVFNTRIETALGSSSNMWRVSLERRRCLVPAWSFFESHATETVPSPRTGKPMRRLYSFARADGTPLILAGIHEAGRFSLVTTEPSTVVAPVHDRMPLALSADGAALWLVGDFATLLDLDSPALEAEPTG